MTTVNTVNVPASELEALREAKEKLEALQQAGVESWAEYDKAMGPIREARKERTDAENLMEEIEVQIFENPDYPAGPDAGIGVSDSDREKCVSLIIDYTRKQKAK